MSETDDDTPIHMPGPIRRNAKLLAAVLFILVIAPGITRLLSNYRAIVLDVEDGRMLVAKSHGPPEWESAMDAEPGEIITKERGSWSSAVTQPNQDDEKLTKLFKRYMMSYEGIIESIQPPINPSAASRAILVDGEGNKRYIPLWGEHLAGASPGRGLRKRPGSWEPELVEPSEIEGVKLQIPQPQEDAPEDTTTETP